MTAAVLTMLPRKRGVASDVGLQQVQALLDHFGYPAQEAA